jgi:hypothetical protein
MAELSNRLRVDSVVLTVCRLQQFDPLAALTAV